MHNIINIECLSTLINEWKPKKGFQCDGVLEDWYGEISRRNRLKNDTIKNRNTFSE